MSAASSRGRISAKCAILAAAALFAASAAQAEAPDKFVEFIQSDGTQYINLGDVLSPNVNVMIDYQVTKANGSYYNIFGYVRKFAYITWDWFYVRGKRTVQTSLNLGRLKVNIDSSRQTISFNGKNQSLESTDSREGSDTSAEAYVFWSKGSSENKAIMKLWSCVISNGNEEVMALYPCVKGTKAGLYDLVSREIFYNASSSTNVFTCGAEVDPPDGYATEYVKVAGSPAEYGTPNPDYGMMTNVTVGTAYTFTCPVAATNDAETIAAKCTGFELALTNGETFVETALSTSIVYSAETACSTLTWLWDVYYRVAATAGANGSVAVSSEWVRPSTTVSVTATPDDGYTFVKWTGDVPSESERVNPLTLSPTSSVSVTATFAPVVVKTVNADGSGDYATLPDALSDLKEKLPSGTYGEIVLSPGDYELTATALVEAPIIIRSSTSNAADVVVYANRKASNFPVFQIDDAESILRDLTISNGYATVSYTGGAVTLVNGGTIDGCRIVNCSGKTSATYGCSGIYANGGVIVDTELLNLTGGSGNGWAVNYTLGIRLLNGAMAKNCTIAGSTGGGQYNNSCVRMDGGTLADCVITNNLIQFAGKTGYGSAVEVFSGDNVIKHCLIADNSYGGASYAGGVRQGGGTLLVDRTTIVWNHNVDVGGFYRSSGTATIRDSIVWGNTSVANLGTDAWVNTADRTASTPRDQNMAGIGNASVFRTCTTATFLNGSISSDPLFVDAAHGDYRLASNSPAVGMGYYDLDGTEPAIEADVADEVSVAAGGDIGAAVVKCRAGGTVRVAAGDYAFSTHGFQVLKGVTVVADEGPSKTILHREGSRYFRVAYIDHPDAVFTGFTVTNAYAGDGAGSAIMVRDGLVTNCVVRNSFGSGGYASLIRCHAGRLSDVTLAYNSGSGEGMGAEITLTGRGCVAEDCVVRDNVGGTGSWGGTFAHAGRETTFRRCQFLRNKTASGVPITLQMCQNSVLENSVIAYNTNNWSNGGAILVNEGTVNIRNCTIVGNTSCGGRAGGIGFNGKAAKVVNTVFRNNTGTGASSDQDVSDDANAVFSNCFFSSAAMISSRSARCVDCDSGDPLFADTYDFTPQKTSPLKNAGKDDVVFTEDTGRDVYGLSRRYGIIDIGAAEYHHTGELSCAYEANGQTTPGGAVTFTASVDGAEDPSRLQYRWRVIADGAAWTDWSSSASWTTNLAVGAYRVKLEVQDPDIPKTVSTDMDGAKTYVASPILHLVDPSTPGHAAAEPYDTESNAATNFTDLVAFAGSGTEVVIHPGNHPVAAAVAFENRANVHGLTANPRDTVVYRPDEVTAGFRVLEFMKTGSALSHVTISNALWETGSQQGVSLNCIGSVVSNCVFIKSTGNAVRNQDGLVTHCLLKDNYGNQAAYRHLGNARIAWSTLTGSRQGQNTTGGMLLDGGEMDHCRVVDNNLLYSSNGSGNGGVVGMGGAVVKNTLIAGNRSGYGGGGVAIAEGSQKLTVINCTIVSNYVVCSTNWPYGSGGVYCGAVSTIIVSNCVVQGNWTTTGPSDYDNGYGRLGTTKVYQSDITNFPGCSIYADCINEDPKFRRRHKSPWCLDATSPCRLKCEPYAGAADDVDLLGAPRVFKGKSDMGCYQYIPYGLSIIVR